MFIDDVLVNVKSASRRLRVDADWLATEAKAGRLPSIQAGDGYLFHLPTLIAALSKRAATADGRWLDGE